MRSASALFLASVGWASTGIAAEAPPLDETRVQLSVQSPTGCASLADLAARVRARSPRIRFVNENADVTVRATFGVGRSGTIVGELKLIEGAQERHLRQLEASSCVDAMDGVALILAITLDPTASVDSVQAAPDGAASNDGGEATGSEPDVGQAPAVTSPAANAGGSARSFDDPPDDPFHAGPARWHFAAFVAAEGSLGATPGLLPALAAYARAGVDRESVWSPAFVLGGTLSADIEHSTEGGTASFDVRALTFDACPLSFDLVPIEARVCVSALWGQLTAIGIDTRNPTGRITRPFAAVGPAALFGWRAGSHFEVSGRLASRVNLIRDEFEFRPTVFHTVAPVTFSASLGVGLYWP